MNRVMKSLFAFLLIVTVVWAFQAQARDTSTDIAVLGDSTRGWSVNSDYDLIPNTTNTYDIGTATLYPAQICLGGTCKTTWGSVVSPMTDTSGYVYPTDAGSNLLLKDDGDITIGGAAATDVAITWDGNADDFYIALDDSADDLVIGYGATIGTDNRITVVDDTNATTIVIGDAQEYDMQIYFDGNAQDYHIGLDDTADDLVIGLGSALGTTTAIGIDENLAIATYGDITMGGTTPVLTVGDAGAEDTAIVFDGNAQDFYVALDDSADDLLIGLGSTVGTTPAISVDENLQVTTYGDIVLTGTTPFVTVGDAGTEDAGFIFDGNAVDFFIAEDDSRDRLVLGDSSTVEAASTAISIDTNSYVYFDTGQVYLQGATPKLTIGDAGAEDAQITWDGNAQDFSLGLDDTTDDLVLCMDSALGTTNIISIADTPTTILLHDASAADASLNIDGNAVDFHISLDDSADELEIGYGTTVETDERLTIGGGTTATTITIGDAAEEDMQLVIDGNAVDFRVALDDSADSLEIGIGSTIETDERITIAGTTNATTITIGDAATEDMTVVYDGNAQDYYFALDDSADDFIIGKGSTVATTEYLTFLNDSFVITVGDASAADSGFLLDGNAQDFYIALDDTADDLLIGLGSAVGTTPAIAIDENLNVTISASLKHPYQIVTATETLTENEGMKLVVLNHATEFATTLPDAASSAGVTFHIVIGAAPSGASYTVVTEGGEDTISGLALVNGASVQADTEDTITFTDGAAAVGDWVELTCDGVLWYVSGQGHAATAIAFTKT